MWYGTVGFSITLDTLQVVLETIFAANHWTRAINGPASASRSLGWY